MAYYIHWEAINAHILRSSNSFSMHETFIKHQFLVWLMKHSYQIINGQILWLPFIFHLAKIKAFIFLLLFLCELNNEHIRSRLIVSYINLLSIASTLKGSALSYSTLILFPFSYCCLRSCNEYRQCASL